MSSNPLRLVWSNPHPKIQMDLFWGWNFGLDLWMAGMNSLLKHVNVASGLWTGHAEIAEGRWIKKICVTDRFRVAYIVLDYNGVELASIPINFSVAILPHLASNNRDAQ